MRGIALLIIVALIAAALLASNAHKPFEMRIDAQSPGVWPKYAAAQRPGEPSPAAPQQLFAPCPLTPQNVPPAIQKEHKA